MEVKVLFLKEQFYNGWSPPAFSFNHIAIPVSRNKKEELLKLITHISA